jgi:hypothetical protein
LHAASEIDSAPSRPGGQSGSLHHKQSTPCNPQTANSRKGPLIASGPAQMRKSTRTVQAVAASVAAGGLQIILGADLAPQPCQRKRLAVVHKA